VSGPGTVTFANANAVDTQASFSLAGTYVLQLTANDGALSASDPVQVTVQAANTAPTVNAGPDLDVILPAQAALNGTVTDDGLPSPPSLTTTWSKVSGPGTVTFQNANAVDTQASFSATGTYVLRITASDGLLSTSDVTQITVHPAGTILRRIAVGTDDAEESSTGNVSRSNNDIELVFSGSNQTVGLRFTSLAIPQGAIITSAAIQFQADETQSEATSLLIQGQAAGTTATFTNTTLDVSSRPRTAASVTWNPVAWSTIGEAGANQRTPDIKAIIQEIVNRPDWVSGGSIVVIISGTGHRTAESYEGLASGAARLELQIQ
jgi:K319-like protein